MVGRDTCFRKKMLGKIRAIKSLGKGARYTFKTVARIR